MEFRAIKDEVAEFLSKSERGKSKNTQNILLDGWYLLFEEYLHGKNICLYPKLCREIGQSFEESLRGGTIIVNYCVILVPVPRVAPNGKYSKNVWNASEKQYTLHFNRMKFNGMIFFTSVKVDNPPAVVPSLIRMMNQE